MHAHSWMPISRRPRKRTSRSVANNECLAPCMAGLNALKTVVQRPVLPHSRNMCSRRTAWLDARVSQCQLLDSQMCCLLQWADLACCPCFLLLCVSLFCFVLFCFVCFGFVLLSFVLSCLVLSCRVIVSCRVVSCLVMSCPVLSCPVLCRSVLFCSVLFCFVLFCFV